MIRLLRTICASLALAAAALPLSALAEPVHLQLGRCDSSVTDVPEMSPQSLQERTLYGLTQAVTQKPEQAILVPSAGKEGVDVRVGAKLGRSGAKFRLVYILQTMQQPRLTHQLTYEFASPKLGNKGMVAMGQDILTEASKLEEARKLQLAEAPPPAVAATPAPEPRAAAPAPSTPDPEPSTSTSEPLSRSERVAALAAQEAEAQGTRPEQELRSKPSGKNRLDLGLAAGLNSPSGILGVEVEFRPVQYAGLNLGAGFGAWGTRFSAQMRLYPLGARGASPFVEGGVSYNKGGEAYLKSGDYAQYADLLPTPVATASLGLRGALGSHLYVVPRVGWGFRLRQENVRTQDGSELNPLLDIASQLSQHGGFLCSLTVGVTLF